MPLTHLGCPTCGGMLSLAEGQRVVPCRYCGAESLALIPGAVPRYVVALGIRQEEAQATAQQLFTRPMLPRGLREHGRIQGVSLCYVPFYEFTGTRLGTFLLRQSERARVPTLEGEAQDTELQRWLLEAPVQKEDTRVVQQTHVRIGPACDLPELGVERIHLDSLRRGATPVALEPYDPVTLQSRAVVFAPTKPPGRFADDSQRRIKVRGDRTGIVEQRLKLLYYPVWQARYHHGGRPYEIAVDGVAGTLLCARAPLEIRHAAALAMAALALAALCLGWPARPLVTSAIAVGRATGWVVGTPGARLALALAGTVALFLAWLGWATFRRGGDLLFTGESAEPVLDSGSGIGVLGAARATLEGWLTAPGTRPPGRD